MNNSKIINVRLMKKVLVLVLSFLSVTAFAQNITVKAITLYLMFLQTEFWSFLTSA